MKRIIVQLIAFLIIINGYAQDEWFLQNSGTTTFINSVFFTTSTTGWACISSFDDTKHLRYSNDGGTTWTPVTTGITDEWTAIYFTSWDVGYLSGWGGKIAKITYNSVSGNFDFTEMTDIPATLHDIYFVNSTTGWTVGSDGTIYKTVNAGVDWNPQTSNIENHLKAVFFTDVSYGWVVGDNGTILHTTNGGTTWNLQTSPYSGFQDDVQFFDRNNGWITANFQLLHTTDGGTNWEYANSSISTNLHLHFTDPLNGWVCGNWGYISHTNDGGQTWYTQNSNTDASFLDIYFYDAYTGWAVGDAGRIIKTTTGGCENFTVDLGPDTAICNGKSFTFYAPYGNGYKYLWNTGANSFYLNIDSAGNYSVITTNNCNTAHSDDVNLIVHPLPLIDLGIDQAFCYGESVILDAGPGYQYHWTGGSSDQTLSVNSTGTYIATITDNNNCQNSDTVSILVHPLPPINLGNDRDICEDESAFLDAGPDVVYLWEDGSSAQTREISASGEYWVNITDINNCKNSDTIQVDVHPLPQIEIQADGPSKLCKGEILNLNPLILNHDGTSDYQYKWNDNPVSAIGQIQVDTNGLYQVTITEDHGCSNEANLEVWYQYPYEDEEIGLVTVDSETGDNLVVWERTTDKGTAYYKIYRGTDTIPIGVVDFNEATVFQDIGTWDDGVSYRYRITVVDTCGFESFYSYSHKTMHLTAGIGTANEVNLAWNHYEGFQVDWYYIYRGTDSTNLQLYDSVQYDPTTMAKTDYNPPPGIVYYRIGVKSPKAYAATALNKKVDSGPYSQSMSNIEDNRLKTGINVLLSESALTVFPNPFSDRTTLKFPNPENRLFRLKIFDLTGKVIRDVNNIAGTEYILEKDNLKEGYYIIELGGDTIYRGRVIVD